MVTQGGAMQDGSGLYDIWKMERRAWTEGPAGSRDFVREDALIVPPAPMPMQSFAQFAQDAERAAPFTDVEMTDRSFAESGATVVITYRVSARHQRYRRRYTARCTTVYARESGRWTVLAHQQARDS